MKEQSAHTGIRSELYKCVYVDGVLQERTLLNKDNYNASKAIYRVGPAVPVEVPAETAPIEPTPTETPEAPVETAPVGPGGPGAGGHIPEVRRIHPPATQAD